MRVLLPCIILAIALLPASFAARDARAAECNGVDIDGQLFDATVYSYSTGGYYNVQVEFDGDEAIIYFSNGGQRRVTLDDEEIDDPDSISAYDYESGTCWEIDISDCDGGTTAAIRPRVSPVRILRFVNVFVNGRKVGTGVLGSNGRVYVPIRLVAEALGAVVQWDSNARRVVISHASNVIHLPMGLSIVTVNGEPRILDSAAALLHQQRA